MRSRVADPSREQFPGSLTESDQRQKTDRGRSEFDPGFEFVGLNRKGFDVDFPFDQFGHIFEMFLSLQFAFRDRHQSDLQPRPAEEFVGKFQRQPLPVDFDADPGDVFADRHVSEVDFDFQFRHFRRFDVLFRHSFNLSS